MTSAAALGGLVALLHVTSCAAPATTSPPPPPTVVLRDIAFRPGTLHVRSGAG